MLPVWLKNLKVIVWILGLSSYLFIAILHEYYWISWSNWWIREFNNISLCLCDNEIFSLNIFTQSSPYLGNMIIFHNETYTKLNTLFINSQYHLLCLWCVLQFLFAWLSYEVMHKHLVACNVIIITELSSCCCTHKSLTTTFDYSHTALRKFS